MSDDFYPWIYRFDHKDKVWRAFHAEHPELEINQYHKKELFWVMDKFGDKVNWDSITKQQVRPLSPDDKYVFLFKDINNVDIQRQENKES